MTDALYICSLVISAKCNMYAGLSMTFVFDGTITKIIIGSTLEKNHVCNTYLNTYTTLIWTLLQVKVAMVFWMTPPLSLLIKLIPKILTNGNTTGDIPLKQWHLNVWILRMIDSCSFVLLIYLVLFIAMAACIRKNQFGYWLWEWR